MADAMNFHTYAKAEKLPSFIILDDTVTEHSYSRKTTVCSHSTPLKRKRNRDASTPTGETPKVIDKKQNVGTTIARWSEKEKKSLYSHLTKFPPTLPVSNEYWRNCAAAINQETGSSRTGASCRSFYNRALLNEPVMVLSKQQSDDLAGISTIEDSAMPEDIHISSTRLSTKNAACQTDLIIPVINSSPMSAQEQQATQESADTHADSDTLVHSILQDRLVAAHKLDTSHINSSDAMDLIVSLFSGDSVDVLAKKIYCIQSLRQNIWKLFISQLEDDSKYSTQRRASYLSDTGYSALVSFDWTSVVREMVDFNPLLLDVLLSASTSAKKQRSADHYKQIVPECGLVYGILMKRRFQDMSRIQRFISLALANERVHQKVYDRLQPMGVTVSHSVLLKVQKHIGGHFNQELIDAVKEGKRFRLVGDNVNFQLTASHQRQGQSKHMEHWFASAAIIQSGDFHTLPNIAPQVPLMQLSADFFLPQQQDWDVIRHEYSVLTLRVITKFLKAFQDFKVLAKRMTEELQPVSQDISSVHKIIPLPVLAKNEQKYTDVVDILDEYENLIAEIFNSAGKPLETNTRVHIGGDQLTRERFSGAKRLRSCANDDREKLSHLAPITFEMFHLQMTVLTVFYKLLYRKDSIEPGTLYAEKIRLSRSDANGDDVKNHYDHCKELAISLIDTYITVAAMKYFGIATLDSDPTQNFPEEIENMTDLEKKEVLLKIINDFVSSMVLQKVQENFENQPTSHGNSSIPIIVCLPDGSRINLMVPIATNQIKSSNVTSTCTSDLDGVKMYGSCVLELGFLYKSVLQNVKIPNRDRFIPLLKYLMCVLKGHSNNSKYALEILRFLCHQLGTLSEKTAQETFYGLFVNTKGKFDTSIGADLQMEHVVRLVKGHLRSVSSNKSEKTLSKRTAAFAGMKHISEEFDKKTDVVIRAHKHRIKSSESDEIKIIKELQTIKPFDEQKGRTLVSYSHPVQSPLRRLELHHLKNWIRQHQYNIYHELGQ